MRAKRRGFTLVELMIVITIIGLLLSLILRAYIGTVRSAERAATVALISKLETTLTDRIDALTSQSGNSTTWSHQWLAGIWVTPASFTAPLHLAPDMPSPQRAQVIAQFDYLRAELPDVFVLDLSDPNYKLNFCALPYSPAGGTATGASSDDYRLPLGAGVADPATGTDTPNVTGMKGASFAAAAAIYKQLGFVAAGTDGADNNNNGLIDEWAEGIFGLPAAQATDLSNQMLAKLANHKHKTARSEMLYAILVEGTGPLGSAFNADDFGPGEVKDTDGDGLMEFVDAWGEPLQFYRWPIMYRSDTQKGFPDLAKIAQDLAAGAPIGPYSTVYEQREQDPLDPNQTLQAPGWWGGFNSKYPWSSPRGAFATLFHTLVDPLAVTVGVAGYAPTNSTINTYWDRSATTTPANTQLTGMYQRRAYYSRFLVLSGGPDKMPGVAQLGVDYRSAYVAPFPPAGLDERSQIPLPGGGFTAYTNHDASGGPVPITVLNVLTIENQAGRLDQNRDINGCPAMAGGRNDTNTFLEELAQDDITTQNLHSAGGPLPAGNP